MSLERLRALRASVLASGPRREPDAAFAAYLDKVARRAYTTTDEEVAALLAAGHGEDEVFEETIGAALAAAITRYEAGLRALDEVGDP
ncbi:MAG TPA: hypothetical protein VIF15_04385 [Polyangiaceae bacterium]|jgi:hypothetical protein